MQILLQASLRLEVSTRDYTAWSRGWLNTASGGTMLFAAGGPAGPPWESGPAHAGSSAGGARLRLRTAVDHASQEAEKEVLFGVVL